MTLTRDPQAFIAKKLCPHLTVVPIHFDRYIEMSGKVMDILRTRDPNMAAASLDEAYLKYIGSPSVLL